MINLVLVDEHEALREGLEDLLGSRGVRTIGTAGSAAAATKLLSEVSPDVAVVGVKLPDESGLRLTRRLLLDQPDLAVLIYTGVETSVPWPRPWSAAPEASPSRLGASTS
jgi:DNA-binding NarL/FixJ family response regulator